MNERRRRKLYKKREAEGWFNREPVVMNNSNSGAAKKDKKCDSKVAKKDKKHEPAAVKKDEKIVSSVDILDTLLEGVSVTKRIQAVKQPWGGYLKLSEFETMSLDDGVVLNEEENIHGILVGLVVDYMTRFLTNSYKEKAFKISLLGAMVAENNGIKGAVSISQELLEKITGLDDRSIINATKLVTFDVWYRNTTGALMAKSYSEIMPDEATISNIRIMIQRGIELFNQFGPVKEYGITFEPADGKTTIRTAKGYSYGGYTNTVSYGDGDFLTADTLWDFKVSKRKPDSKQTLQILMYWIMGQHSGKEEFKGITKIGFFNPRMNLVYRFDMSKLPMDTIRIIENEIICY